GLADRVLEAAGGPVDGVADFVGGVLDDTLAVLAEGGTHASVADPSVAEHGGRYIWGRPDGAETARLGLLADEAQRTVDVAGTYGRGLVADAFKDSAVGHVRGKLVIVPRVADSSAPQRGGRGRAQCGFDHLGTGAWCLVRG